MKKTFWTQLLSSSHPKLFHKCSTKSALSCWCICLSRILVRTPIILAIFEGISVEYVRSTCEFRCLLLVGTLKHQNECIDYHIMEYDTCSNNPLNFGFILKKCWIFNNGKSSLQNSESTLDIFSDSFLTLRK